MNWEATGAVGEILGAIAVVATLGYLANQIRQSTRVAKADISQRMSEQVQALYMTVFANSDAAELVDRIGTNGEPIDGADSWRWYSFALSNIEHAENLYYQYRVGTLDKARFVSLMAPVHARFNLLPRLRHSWMLFRDQMEPDFRSHMDKHIVKDTPTDI